LTGPPKRREWRAPGERRRNEGGRRGRDRIRTLVAVGCGGGESQRPPPNEANRPPEGFQGKARIEPRTRSRPSKGKRRSGSMDAGAGQRARPARSRALAGPAPPARVHRPLTNG